MFAGISGFVKLRAWLPQALVDLLDPHATIGSEAARAMLADAISITLGAMALLLILSVLSGLRDVVTGRAMHERTSRFLGFVRSVSMLLVIGLPWWAVWKMFETGATMEDIWVGVPLAAFAWVLAVVTDHGHVWYQPRDRVIVLRSGFAIFRTIRANIHLDRALRWVHNRHPVGGALARPRRSGEIRDVALDPEAWERLRAQMGEQRARAWLGRLLKHYRLALSAATTGAGGET